MTAPGTNDDPTESELVLGWGIQSGNIEFRRWGRSALKLAFEVSKVPYYTHFSRARPDRLKMFFSKADSSSENPRPVIVWLFVSAFPPGV